MDSLARPLLVVEEVSSSNAVSSICRVQMRRQFASLLLTSEANRKA